MIDGFPRGMQLKFIACPHQATLILPQAGQLTHIPIDMDCPELVALRQVIERMAKCRRPPQKLVRAFNQRMEALTVVLERRARKEMAMAN